MENRAPAPPTGPRALASFTDEEVALTYSISILDLNLLSQSDIPPPEPIGRKKRQMDAYLEELKRSISIDLITFCLVR